MKTILIQLDTDRHPSSFDRVVAVDAGVDEIFSYGGVTPENVVPLVHGAIFTRGPEDLKNTAIFVGGSNVAEGEAVAQAVQGAFFGPMRVSVLLDSNGSNTTAAAAVLAAGRHLDLGSARATVLGGTGPVGLRAAQLLAREGAAVRLASRSLERAESAVQRIKSHLENANLTPCRSDTPENTAAAVENATLIIAAGAAGVELLTAEQRAAVEGLQVAIDLNAVPPAGIAGIEVTDKAADREGAVCYGAVGVGGTKMKIHKAAVQALFESNSQVLETEAVFGIGRVLEA